MRRVEMSEVCKVGGKTDKSGKKGRSAIYAHTILIVRNSRIEEVVYPDLQDSIDEAVLQTPAARTASCDCRLRISMSQLGAI